MGKVTRRRRAHCAPIGTSLTGTSAAIELADELTFQQHRRVVQRPVRIGAGEIALFRCEPEAVGSLRCRQAQFGFHLLVGRHQVVFKAGLGVGLHGLGRSLDRQYVKQRAVLERDFAVDGRHLADGLVETDRNLVARLPFLASPARSRRRGGFPRRGKRSRVSRDQDGLRSHRQKVTGLTGAQSVPRRRNTDRVSVPQSTRRCPRSRSVNCARAIEHGGEGRLDAAGAHPHAWRCNRTRRVWRWDCSRRPYAGGSARNAGGGQSRH